MKKAKCSVCGYVYDPRRGDPVSDVETGVEFDDLPGDWVCPICRAKKSKFIKER